MGDLQLDLLETVEEGFEAAVGGRGVDEEVRIAGGCGGVEELRIDAVGNDGELVVGNGGVERTVEAGFDEDPVDALEAAGGEFGFGDDVVEVEDDAVGVDVVVGEAGIAPEDGDVLLVAVVPEPVGLPGDAFVVLLFEAAVGVDGDVPAAVMEKTREPEDSLLGAAYASGLDGIGVPGFGDGAAVEDEIAAAGGVLGGVGVGEVEGLERVAAIGVGVGVVGVEGDGAVVAFDGGLM